MLVAQAMHREWIKGPDFCPEWLLSTGRNDFDSFCLAHQEGLVTKGLGQPTSAPPPPGVKPPPDPMTELKKGVKWEAGTCQQIKGLAQWRPWK